jgi:hypothetical protein
MGREKKKKERDGNGARTVVPCAVREDRSTYFNQNSAQQQTHDRHRSRRALQGRLGDDPLCGSTMNDAVAWSLASCRGLRQRYEADDRTVRAQRDTAAPTA